MHSRIQPIAIRDVLRYLVGCASLPAEVNRSFDIGGPDVLTYADMMRRYAVIAGLPRRIIVPVPLLTPRLSSLWVGLVTPVPGSLARPLVESLRHEVVCREHDIADYVPDPPEGSSASSGQSSLPCSGYVRRRCPPAGPRPPSRERPATRCPPTRTGREAAFTPMTGNRPSKPHRGLCGG